MMSGVAQARPATPANIVATPALWRVQDADTTIYLFGTVHVMKPGIDWFRGDVKAAFDGADELVLEIIEPDDPNVMGAVMMSKAVAGDGVALSAAHHLINRHLLGAMCEGRLARPWPARTRLECLDRRQTSPL